MTITAFEGPAGSGKTHRLMDELIAVLERAPLQAHQRVLAVTYMHGSRRRLDSRLAAIVPLKGRYEAVVLDGFAWRLIQRWRRLVAHLGYAAPQEHDFDACCELAARLMEIDHVAAWVKATFPIMLVDEAQDFCAHRSAIVTALSRTITVLVAFDEFQCLQPDLRPVPIQAWLAANAEPISLTGNHRTNRAQLLAAADAVRQGARVVDGGREFKLVPTPGLPLMATWLANAIRFRDGANVAVLTPTRMGPAQAAVARVCAGPIGRHGSGPFEIRWENTDEQEVETKWAGVGLDGQCSVADAVAALHAQRDDPILLRTRDWLKHKERTLGIESIHAAEIRGQVERLITRRRQFGDRREARFCAMTIHQAKNREFDDVVVIWPHRVPTGDDQRRRLLYNAITRARRRCTVLVQAASLLQTPPFSPAAEAA